MHSLVSGNIVLIHNTRNGESVDIPFAMLEELVAEKIRSERINALEQADAREGKR